MYNKHALDGEAWIDYYQTMKKEQPTIPDIPQKPKQQQQQTERQKAFERYKQEMQDAAQRTTSHHSSATVDAHNVNVLKQYRDSQQGIGDRTYNIPTVTGELAIKIREAGPVAMMVLSPDEKIAVRSYLEARSTLEPTLQQDILKLITLLDDTEGFPKPLTEEQTILLQSLLDAPS
ncbi:hypothetical protein GF380_00615 [Candidatus Uhrbacteria bacterium]|nr:hypothetical protein [Candidatus Uhrbacteria bacterium]MBD3283877.1 hypothetical protein [Candidatus Uhrbacteria bacterium]